VSLDFEPKFVMLKLDFRIQFSKDEEN